MNTTAPDADPPSSMGEKRVSTGELAAGANGPPLKQRSIGWVYRLLASEKAPFLFALLLAALAWCVTRVADRAVALPIIEYAPARLSSLPKSIDKYQLCERSKGLNAYAFSIRNISKQVAFANLVLYFYASEDQIISETRWVNRPPGLALPDPPACDVVISRARTLTLGQLQPGWSGTAVVWTSDTRPPLLIFELPQPAGSVTEARAVYLVESNITTWIIWYEFELYYAAIVLLAVLIVWYGVIYAKRD